jgi:L-fuconolactonase
VTEADWASWSVAGLRPYVDVVIETFGPNRLLFGSDWPVCLLAADYTTVVETAQELVAGLSSEEVAMVFGGTAERVYGLPAA